MKTKELEIFTVAEGASEHLNFALILRDKSVHNHHLPIVISQIEADTLSRLLSDKPILKKMRPVTHQLFVDTLDALGAVLSEVLIYKFEMGVFYTKLMLIRLSDRKTISIESRVSDAVIIAHIAKVPLLIDNEVMETTCVEVDTEDIKQTEALNLHELDTEFVEDFLEKTDSEMSNELELFEAMLTYAIDEEEYKTAAQLQKIIDKYKALKQ